ncbi:MAG: SUMF1/EgtB/PvdO family nonheme iron enzyme [Candidatus Omnitrophica bacterium]|nr:SUMF1/EgtB/PvdO family nonheme iron enzyme [Candidatus Omnitrophota bacterium]
MTKLHSVARESMFGARPWFVMRIAITLVAALVLASAETNETGKCETEAPAKSMPPGPVPGPDSFSCTLPGCLLWLDAADIDGDGIADAIDKSRSVSRWTDKSGGHQDAIQESSNSQPTFFPNARGSKPALRFDGNDYLVDSLGFNWSGTDWELYVVAALDRDAPDNWRGIIGNRFGAGKGYWWTLGTQDNGDLYLELGAGVGVTAPIKARDSGLQIYHVTKTGPQFSLDRNLTRIGIASQLNAGGPDNQLRIGRWFGEGQEWNGFICEIILYNRNLNGNEQDVIERYLGHKWGLIPWRELYVKKETWLATQLEAREAYWRQMGPSASAIQDTGDDLWAMLKRDFNDPVSRRDMAWEREDGIWQFLWQPAQWAVLARRYAQATSRLPQIQERAAALASSVRDEKGLAEVRTLYQRSRRCAEVLESLKGRLDFKALRLAIEDLTQSFPQRYSKGPEFLRRLSAYEAAWPRTLEAIGAGDEPALRRIDEMLAFQREALLANPLLDFDRLLVVRRSTQGPGLGLPQNWQSNATLPRHGWDNEIAILSPVGPQGRLTTLYRPAKGEFVGDVDLDFDAGKLLFSSIDSRDCWQVFEIKMDGTGLRQVTPTEAKADVHNYDPCYLPDGRILFASTAGMAAVACVNGSDLVATLYRIDADGQNMRQLCFDQEQNWCPTILNNGRVLYQRWEYTDTPHTHARLLFHMNPDGTGQMEFYGSNSYWPDALFYARPIPGSPSEVVAIVGGHHGVPRMGELVILDPAKGRREADGVVQRIPGRGKKVEALIEDNLVDNSWPKFLHPYPLSGKYFLVSSQPAPGANWGIYLVDVFDNRLLIKELPGYVLFEPVPVRNTPRPPVIPDQVDLAQKDAVVYLADVYAGDGLKGIPRGTIKQLRLFTYHYLFPGMGGPQAVVGMEGPWDIKRVLGTVPVQADGSAYFRVPAQMPISVQPLDSEGKAVQLMRSWFTGMPGEVVSCVGCHDTQNSAPINRRTKAMLGPPSEIVPWHGPVRGFNFAREVQPVLDRYCVSCHDGRSGSNGKPVFDLRGTKQITDYSSVFHSGGRDAGHFSVSYAELHRYVRRGGLESDYHLLTPMEFHADSTRLVQMLRQGHGGVRLDAEAWDRIITWIDLNAPFHGTWTEVAGKDRVQGYAQRRRELLQRYAGQDEDYEEITAPAVLASHRADPEPVMATPAVNTISVSGWPFDAAEARRRQTAAVTTRRIVDLGNGMTMEFVLIPAGESVMGDPGGCPDEQPRTAVRIAKPFWMGRFEVSNEQFACFDPSHNSGVESRFSMQFGVRGFYVDGPKQPVVRISWQQAMAFCDWLSSKTGLNFTLPTEAQWEYACRAGTATPFYYGDTDTDFSKFANLADLTIREFVCHTYKKEREPWLNASKYDDWIPRDARFNDGGFLSDQIGGYRPNAWGLYDMHGNVAEWTRSVYRPYPYRDDDGRNRRGSTERRVVRGGSWRDLPAQARSGYRLAYWPYQPVFNVGFRVVMEASEWLMAHPGDKAEINSSPQTVTNRQP